MAAEVTREQLAEQLVDVYPRAVPIVYGFVLARCGDAGLAEELMAQTFLAAVEAVRRQTVAQMTPAWLVMVARRRLIDHWRRQSVEDRHLKSVASDQDELVDPWEGHLDAVLARKALMSLSPQHRAALTLRYLDGLSVAEVADHLERGLHATEALLQRARTSLRRAYIEGVSDAD